MVIEYEATSDDQFVKLSHVNKSGATRVIEYEAPSDDRFASTP